MTHKSIFLREHWKHIWCLCCSMLQHVAACCSMLQHVAAFCSMLQCIAVCCSVLQCVAVYYSVLQWIAVCCSSESQCIDAHARDSLLRAVCVWMHMRMYQHVRMYQHMECIKATLTCCVTHRVPGTPRIRWTRRSKLIRWCCRGDCGRGGSVRQIGGASGGHRYHARKTPVALFYPSHRPATFGQSAVLRRSLLRLIYSLIRKDAKMSCRWLSLLRRLVRCHHSHVFAPILPCTRR